MGQDRNKAAPDAQPAPEAIPASRDVVNDREMGSALRSVYQRTVDEQVPDDLLDLLGKLS